MLWIRRIKNPKDTAPIIKALFIIPSVEKEILIATPEKRSQDNAISSEPKKEYAPSEYDDAIRDLLDEYVRPAVANDGGAIDFRGYENGIVTVVLKGACSGCPSSTATLKGGIESLLKEHLPDVTEVVAENE